MKLANDENLIWVWVENPLYLRISKQYGGALIWQLPTNLTILSESHTNRMIAIHLEESTKF